MFANQSHLQPRKLAFVVKLHAKEELDVCGSWSSMDAFNLASRMVVKFAYKFNDPGF